MHDDESILANLERACDMIDEAVAEAGSPERAGVLRTLRVMLRPSVEAARLLRDTSTAAA